MQRGEQLLRRVERLYTDKLRINGERWDVIYYKIGAYEKIWRLLVYRGSIDAED